MSGEDPRKKYGFQLGPQALKLQGPFDRFLPVVDVTTYEKWDLIHALASWNKITVTHAATMWEANHSLPAFAKIDPHSFKGEKPIGAVIMAYDHPELFLGQPIDALLGFGQYLYHQFLRLESFQAIVDKAQKDKALSSLPTRYAELEGTLIETFNSDQGQMYALAGDLIFEFIASDAVIKKKGKPKSAQGQWFALLVKTAAREIQLSNFIPKTPTLNKFINPETHEPLSIHSFRSQV